MRLYFRFFVMFFVDINVFSQRVSCGSPNICKPRMFNGHYVKWPSPKSESDYLLNKDFKPKNIIFTRFQICGDRVFLVSPRYREGVPFTLSYAMIDGDDQCYNFVRPFPDSEKSSIDDDNKSIVNAIDIYMGQNGTLWLLDIGIINTLKENPERECEAKILAINYVNGRIIHSIPLKALMCRLRSRLQYILVEYVDNDKPIVYVGDGGTRSIIVWNVRANEGYRVKLPSSSSATCVDPAADDVFYLVLIEKSNVNYVYFTYLSSTDMFKVRTNDLRKRINPKCIVNVGRKPCRMVILGSGYGTVIYFRIKGLNHLYGWDARESFLEENIMLIKKSIDCRTITHVDVDNNGVLWELESNIEDFVVNAVGCYGASVILAPVSGDSVPLKTQD